LRDNCNYIYDYYACVCPDAQIYDADGNLITTDLCKTYAGDSFSSSQRCDVYKYLLSSGGACSCFIGSEQSYDYYERLLTDPDFKNTLASLVGINPTCRRTCIDYVANCVDGGCQTQGELTYSEPCTSNICIVSEKILTGDIKADKINIGNVKQVCGTNPDTKYSCINNVCTTDPAGIYSYDECSSVCAGGPQELYSCSNGNCVQSSTGTSLQDCLANCENSGMKFVCNNFEEICQQDLSGTSNETYNDCTTGCSRVVRETRIVSIVLLITLILLLTILIFLSY
jgi:hypothetical protein